VEENMKTGTITIGDFNELYKKGTIYPYKNNRGGRQIDTKRVNKYAAAWDTASSGCVVVEKTPQGYMLRDFHNRAEAIRRGVEAGKIPEKDNLLIRVIPPGDGLTAYRRINAAVGHTKRDKLTNADLCFGYEIQKILLHTKALEDVATPNKFYHQLAYAIIDLKLKKRSEYALSSGSSQHLLRYIDAAREDANELSLSVANVKLIANAASYWLAINNEVISECPTATLPKPIEKIMSSAQFFGFTIFDHMFHRKMGDAAKVAVAIVKNQRKVEEVVKRLATGSMESKLEASRNLLTMLS
jgi:hypothetical protein